MLATAGVFQRLLQNIDVLILRAVISYLEHIIHLTFVKKKKQ